MSVLRYTSISLASTCMLLVGGLGFSAVAGAQNATTAAETQAAAMQPAADTKIISFDIPAQDLGAALAEFGRQSEQELFYAPEAVAGKNAAAISGSMTSTDAIKQLLQGTELEYLQVPDGGVMIGSPTSVEAYRTRLRERSSEATHTFPQGAMVAAAAAGGEDITAESVTSTRRGGIEEIIVTARKREESVEDIPISITALNAEDLKQFGVRNFADLEGVVPGLNLGGGGNGVKKDSSPYIRGIGQRETKVTLDSAVATYIDGIYIGRAAGAMLDVTDVAGIQVLRGPQGTLFGRNATGGAIAVTLKKPDNRWSGEVTTNIGNFGRQDISGVFNAPLIEDKLMGRLFVASTNSEGYFTNVVDNTTWGGDNRVSGIAQLRYLPTENITLDVLGERTRIRETPRPQHCAFIREPGFSTVQSSITGFGDVGGGVYYNTFEDFCRESQALPPNQFASDEAIGDRLQPQGRYWVDTSTVGATGTWDIGDVGPFSGVTAKSISAWRKTEQIADEDLDAVAAPTLMRIQPSFDKTTQFSEELQFSARTFNDRLFLSTGFYFFKERTPQNVLNLSAGVSPEYSGDAFGVPPGFYTSIFAEGAQETLETDNKAFAWYGQFDFNITKELELSAGIRGTRETRWSRYSKGYLDPASAYEGVVSALEANGIGYVTYTQPGIKPIFDWVFGGTVYTLETNPVDGDITLSLPGTFVPGLAPGDELSTTDVAWTPMANLKYNFGERMLERLSLDHAMLYLTYSEGFHAGGVTAGAVDYDTINAVVRNIPAETGIPCPQNRVSCRIDTLAGPGGGAADPQIFKPEKVVNYEAGIKLAALDRRLQASLSAFYMDYTDMQVTSTASRLGIPIPFIENVGSSVIKGLEWELTALPTPEWRILLNGSFTDADIKEWDSQQVLLNFATGQDTGVRYSIDRSDERMPRVPRWQFFVSTDYSFRLQTGGVITPSVAVRYTSEIYHGFDRGSWIYSHGGRYFSHGGDVPPRLAPNSSFCTGPSPDPQCGWHGANNNPQADPLVTPSPDAKWTTTSRPTAFLDARVAWISGDGKMEAALWGKNLTNNDDYLVGGIPLADVTGGVGMVFGNPRTFGLMATYHFGE